MAGAEFERPDWSNCGEASYQAARAGLTITLTAAGKHSKAGYDVRFRQLPQDVFPPEFTFEHCPPSPKVSGVIRETAFSETHELKLPPHFVPVKAVFVTDAHGRHEVHVRDSVD